MTKAAINRGRQIFSAGNLVAWIVFTLALEGHRTWRRAAILTAIVCSTVNLILVYQKPHFENPSDAELT